MRKFLNPPIDNFTRYINEKIFVDKSGIIDYTNSVIDSLDAFICVSRPRRFGKSVVANMLVAYYESGCKSKTLFKHLAISKTKLFKKHLNKYNVIYIDMADYFKSDIEVSAGLEKLKDELVDEFNKEYTDRSFDKDKMVSMFNEIYERTNRKFVFVIDEWDCPFRRRVGDVKGQKKYLEFLNELLKEKNYVALAYMTGILPIKKTGDESSLNMFSEKTIINASPLQEYFGFTESEVESLCKKFGCSYEGVRFWYDGYTVNGIQLYNPRSVVEAIKSGVLENYWTQTQTFEALQSYIGANLFGIHDAITTLLSGEHIKIDTTKFKNDMVTFKSGDDILTLLVHLGYLTYDIETKKVGIPNHEIYSEFMSVITDMGWEDTVRQIETSEKAMGAILAKDEKTVAEIVAAVHRQKPVLNGNKETTLYEVVNDAFFTARNYYSLVPEMPAGGGFIDILFIPNRNTSRPMMVVELKSNSVDTEKTALKQIKDNHYTEALSGYKGKILLVGISYKTEREEHTCVIEEVEKN